MRPAVLTTHVVVVETRATYGTVSTPTATRPSHTIPRSRRGEVASRCRMGIPTRGVVSGYHVHPLTVNLFLRAAFSISSATLGTNRFGTTKWGKGFRRLRQRRLSTISLSGLVASTIATVRRVVKRGLVLGHHTSSSSSSHMSRRLPVSSPSISDPMAETTRAGVTISGTGAGRP